MIDPFNDIKDDLNRVNNFEIIPFMRECPSLDSKEFAEIEEDMCKASPMPLSQGILKLMILINKKTYIILGMNAVLSRAHAEDGSVTKYHGAINGFSTVNIWEDSGAQMAKFMDKMAPMAAQGCSASNLPVVTKPNMIMSKVNLSQR